VDSGGTWVSYLFPGFQSHVKFPLDLICHNLSFGETDNFLRLQEIPQELSRVEWLTGINEWMRSVSDTKADTRSLIIVSPKREGKRNKKKKTKREKRNVPALVPTRQQHKFQVPGCCMLPVPAIIHRPSGNKALFLRRGIQSDQIQGLHKHGRAGNRLF
jgi:hypothetical protein